MRIDTYQKDDENAIMALIESEGEDWKDYYEGPGRAKYLFCLSDSFTLVARLGAHIIGYLRAMDDHGFGIYVCDLLVHKDHRGKQIGKQMMDELRTFYPKDDIYVMSDVDPYYIKQGYKNIGTIFQIP